ncbi:MAG: aminotransferase class V-fold PLP-dependent enzyme [Candidatus Eisenbacteria bacterium]|nr:aminotransferase class V-fold PLP-dependent enzyme [Candidatus Eisenbacteria bacterium]
MRLPVYLDHHATTPCDPQVVEAMLPFFTERFGNPASRSHRYGWEAEEAVHRAREEIARAIGARAKEIVFTSGATEANNLAIKGVLEDHGYAGSHVVACVTEHASVLDPLAYAEGRGTAVTYLPVDEAGRIDPERVRDAIRENTVLVTVMAANNEIGTIPPLDAIGKVARERGVLFHTDAAQAFGKIPIDVDAMHVDLLSLSGHKIYGPKGIGALYARRREPRVRLEAQIHGGGHERKMRSGTLNVPGAVGLGRAAAIARERMETDASRIAGLRDRFYMKIISSLDRVRRNGDPERSLPNTLSLTFEFVEAEALLMDLEDVAITPASACSSGSFRPSHVLLAIGLGVERALSTVRFGLGRFTTEEEVDFAAEKIVEAVRRLRSWSPLYEEEREK